MQLPAYLQPDRAWASHSVSTHLMNAFGYCFISTLEGVGCHQPALKSHRLGCTWVQQDLAHLQQHCRSLGKPATCTAPSNSVILLAAQVMRRLEACAWHAT